MNISVIQRITGGYGLLIVLLLVVGYTGVSSISSINHGLKQVTEQAGPIGTSTSDLNARLAQLNLAMYQHYNSSKVSQLSEYESYLSDFSSRYPALSNTLKDQLREVSGSEDALNQLDSIDKTTPALLTKIEQAMDLYRRSFDGLSTITTLQNNINDITGEMPALTTRLSRLKLQPEDRDLVLAAEKSLLQGISIAKQLTYVQNQESFRGLGQEFVTWLDEHVKLGFKLEELAKREPVRANAIKAIGELASRLAWEVANDNGLRETKGFYLSTRASLETSLADNERELQSIRGQFADINAFANDFKTRVSSAADSSVGNSQTLIIVISLIGITIACAIAFLIVGSIRKPLNAMITTLGEIANGNLSNYIKDDSNDEFGQLKKSAISLNQSLRDVIEAIQTQAHSILEAVRSTRETTGNTRDALNQQKAETEMVASAMHEMTATIREIAALAENTFQQMLTAYDSAQASQSQVEANKQLNTELQSEMSNAAGVIDKLDGDVHKIEEIIQVIDGIAQQTNLLALNAAIEAARAGEQGRGFAVVADEVRTLASRTQSSTEEIKANIETLLGASKQAVNAINSSQEKTQAANDMAQEIYDQIGRIVQLVSETKDMNMQIATAAEEQSRTSDEINNNVTRIADLAEITNTGASENESQISNLHGASESLETLIDRFKV